MSTARPREGKAKNSIVSNLEQQQQQQLQTELHEVSSSSSWEKNNNNKNINISNNNSTSMSTPSLISHKVEESDEDLLTVPDVENPPAIDSAIANSNTDTAHPAEFQNQKRRRGRNPADKEYRRLKRLLRNRVSAQQARERKKVYVNDLELRAKQLQDRNSKLEEKISTLINENTMLRKVLLNTRPKVDESTEQKQDQLSKS